MLYRKNVLIPHISDRHKDSNNKQISMNKKQTYAAPNVDQVVIFPREAVLDITSPTSNESLAIYSIMGVGSGENDGIAW